MTKSSTVERSETVGFKTTLYRLLKQL